MDSWSAQQLKMMQAGGNDGLNKFVAVRERDAAAPRARARADASRTWRAAIRRPEGD